MRLIGLVFEFVFGVIGFAFNMAFSLVLTIIKMVLVWIGASFIYRKIKDRYRD